MGPIALYRHVAPLELKASRFPVLGFSHLRITHHALRSTYASRITHYVPHVAPLELGRGFLSRGYKHVAPLELKTSQVPLTRGI